MLFKHMLRMYTPWEDFNFLWIGGLIIYLLYPGKYRLLTHSINITTNNT